MIDLSNPIERQQAAIQIGLQIDVACVKHFKDDPRKHLGASIIGHGCSAYLWNTFRWLKQEAFDGRMLRLFNRGHLEESRFIQWLKLIGFEVWEVDSTTGNQFKISGCNGHFGGSLDAGLYRADIGKLLGEFKTHNNKYFLKIKKEGVRKAKPQHFKQMCSYGKAYQIRYGLYCAVNKDTDELYFEIVELDFALADDLFKKAEEIIYSKTQPRKISQVRTYYECKYCHFNAICFDGEVPEKNCRSCEHASPGPNASWICGVVAEAIPNDVIPVGCNSYRRII